LHDALRGKAASTMPYESRAASLEVFCLAAAMPERQHFIRAGFAWNVN
jgi:hypothetical protein